MTTPSTTRSEELKPCPFCGSTDLRVAFNHEAGRWDIWEVECEHCIISIDSPTGFTGDAAREAAIAAWNERIPNPDDALREALEEVESMARLFASFYPEASDGRNTFVIFADKIAALASTHPKPLDES